MDPGRGSGDRQIGKPDQEIDRMTKLDWRNRAHPPHFGMKKPSGSAPNWIFLNLFRNKLGKLFAQICEIRKLFASSSTGADNLVPMELALKIASKIIAKERFAVYVVIPMWPEGDPTSAPVQEILFWQQQTRQMMYGMIARELQSMQLADSHPLDYLNFYCLGKREEMPEEGLRQDATTAANGIKDDQREDLPE
ncbi:phospholipase D [Sarracenia purpurea var. burkii]